MKIFYWNIKNSLSAEKKSWIENAIDSEKPDVLCIAEGPESIRDCLDIVNIVLSKGYRTYYIPTYYSQDVIANQFGWNKFGLKVFIKHDTKLMTRFTFGNQKLEGRIIY